MESTPTTPATFLCWSAIFICAQRWKELHGCCFSANAQMFYIRSGSISVNSGHSMIIVEQYCALKRRIFYIICNEAAKPDKDLTLQIAFEIVNDMMGPNWLIPTPLVLNALLQLEVPTFVLHLRTFRRAGAISKWHNRSTRTVLFKISVWRFQISK